MTTQIIPRRAARLVRSDENPRPKPGPRKSRQVVKRRTQEERRTTTRRLLIEAAIECLSELGYLEATVEVVAKRAGVSRGAVQHHFGSRNELMIAVVEDLGSALANSNEIVPGLTIEERVDAAIDQTWELLRSSHFVAVVQIWLATRNVPEVIQLINKSVSLFEREMDAVWQRSFSQTGIPSEKIAVIRHIVLAALRGLALRALYRKGRASWIEEIAMLKSMVKDAMS